jgi:hypothetical protein
MKRLQEERKRIQEERERRQEESRKLIQFTTNASQLPADLQQQASALPDADKVVLASLTGDALKNSVLGKVSSRQLEGIRQRQTDLSAAKVLLQHSLVDFGDAPVYNIHGLLSKSSSKIFDSQVVPRHVDHLQE